jgi:hypothetical protein
MAAAFPTPASPHVYQRHRPETTALYEVVRDNLRAEPVARPGEERAAAPEALTANVTDRLRT